MSRVKDQRTVSETTVRHKHRIVFRIVRNDRRALVEFNSKKAHRGGHFLQCFHWLRSASTDADTYGLLLLQVDFKKTPDPFYFSLLRRMDQAVEVHERFSTWGIDADLLVCFFGSSQTCTGAEVTQTYEYKTRFLSFATPFITKRHH